MRKLRNLLDIPENFWIGHHVNMSREEAVQIVLVRSTNYSQIAEWQAKYENVGSLQDYKKYKHLV